MAFDRRCLWSNMGGVEGSLDDGLTKFKDNFNPTINEFIGEFDIPVYPIMYRLTQKAYEILKDLTENPAGYIAEKAAARGEGDEVWADDWAADIQVVKWLKENDGKRLYKENQAYILKILAFQEK